MKKKIFALLMAVVMIWGTVPVTAWAAEESGQQINVGAFVESTEENKGIHNGEDLSQEELEEEDVLEEPETPDIPDISPIIGAIAETYVNNSNEWVIFDMAAYAALNRDSVSKTTPEALQSYINYAIGTVGDYTTGTASEATTYAKAEIILSSIGGDTAKLYQVNSNTPLDNREKLRGLTVTSLYDAPWVLLADLQGNVQLTETQVEQLIQSIGSVQAEDGLFYYTYDGVDYSDVDTTGTVLAALAPYYDTQPEAKAIVDLALTGLSSMQNQDGSFGSANSDAMVVIGLAAMGIDPFSDSRFVKEGSSLMDGLLSYMNAGKNGFTYFGEDNAFATEQGFRALIAAAQFKAKAGAFQIYDFSGNQTSALRATGTGPVVKPKDPEGDGTITVRFTLKSQKDYWISNKKLTLQKGSTVYHAMIAAFGDEFEQVGSANGYVSSVTNVTTGETLGEFDQGGNSGWLYKVNDATPSLGLTDYKLQNGDRIVLYYTNDWTKDSGSSDLDGTQKNKAELPEEKPMLLPFEDISDHWAREAIGYAYHNGLLKGLSQSEFGPDIPMTRAMLATVLYRMSGEPAVNGNNPYKDVEEGTWYRDAILWAREKSIAQGFGDGRFGVNDFITRQEMAVMLMAYGECKGLDVSRRTDFHQYTDAEEIAPWARSAMEWANAEGLITGRTTETLDPRSPASRGEVAALLKAFSEKTAA